MAGAVHIEQASATQRAAGAEHLGVQVVIVHATVNHVHPFWAAGGAHVDEIVFDKQVLPLYQFHPHLLGQKGVLKVGAVVHARGQNYHGRLGSGGRAAGAQGLQQQVGVMGHRRHPVRIEQLGEQAHHHLAVLEHVAHATGHTQVVFEHVVLALARRIGRAHDVDTRDVRVDLVRHIHAHHLRPKLGIAHNLLARHHAGTQNILAVVDVVNESVQGGHPLHQAAFQGSPLMSGDDAGDQVEGNQSLGPGALLVFLAVDGKGDAHSTEDHFRFFTSLGHHVARLPREPLVVNLVMVPNLRPVGKKLVRQTRVHLIKFLHRHLFHCPKLSKLCANWYQCMPHGMR